MNLGNMIILNPMLLVPNDDKVMLEDFVRGLVHSPYFAQLVLNLLRDDRVSSVNLRGLMNEMTMFESSGFMRFIELSQFHGIEELFSPVFISFLRLKR
ncbi:hypothetical protein [Agarivorans aestuarii]|uniref:hypothetical protein n=1 Tax=Agarivorans aestuarii TaxID=1563703 RepID=UPI001C8263C0|nr:hypothetical protein [Agarivorans aestuarii]